MSLKMIDDINQNQNNMLIEAVVKYKLEIIAEIIIFIFFVWLIYLIDLKKNLPVQSPILMQPKKDQLQPTSTTDSITFLLFSISQIS